MNIGILPPDKPNLIQKGKKFFRDSNSGTVQQKFKVYSLCYDYLLKNKNTRKIPLKVIKMTEEEMKDNYDQNLFILNSS